MNILENILASEQRSKSAKSFKIGIAIPRAWHGGLGKASIVSFVHYPETRHRWHKLGCLLISLLRVARGFVSFLKLQMFVKFLANCPMSLKRISCSDFFCSLKTRNEPQVRFLHPCARGLNAALAVKPWQYNLKVAWEDSDTHFQSCKTLGKTIRVFSTNNS